MFASFCVCVYVVVLYFCQICIISGLYFSIIAKQIQTSVPRLGFGPTSVFWRHNCKQNGMWAYCCPLKVYVFQVRTVISQCSCCSRWDEVWTKSLQVILSVLDLFLHVKFVRLNLGRQTSGQQRKPSSLMWPRSKVPAETYITGGLSEFPDTQLGFTITFMALQYIAIQSLVNMQEGKLKSS